MDDAELLSLYAGRRDEAAFAELVRRHLGLVYHTALRHVGGDAHAAQDVAQEVFTDLARKASSLDQRTVLGGWLYSRARYGGLTAMRTRRRRQAREIKATMLDQDTRPGEPAADWELIRPVIDEALHHLKQRDRDAVLLRYFEGLSFAEIASRLGSTEDAVRVRVNRALDKLRDSLTAGGVPATAATLALSLSAQAGAAVPQGLAAAVTAGALATVAAQTGGLAALFQTMNVSKLITAAALVAGLAGIGYTVQVERQATAGRSAAAAASHDNEALSEEALRLEHQARQAQADIAAMRANLERLRTDGTPGRSARTSRPQSKAVAVLEAAKGKVPDGPPINRELTKDPKVRAAFAAWISGCFSVEYGPLFKALGLSAEQQQKILDLMPMFDSNMGTAMVTLRPEDETNDDIRETIKGILGDSSYKQFEEYGKTIYVRTVATSLASNLFDSDAPLTPAQADQLTEILGKNSIPVPGTSYSLPGTINWEPALQEAGNVLSPPQLATLRNLSTMIASQPGLWGALMPLSPGALGTTPIPPLGFLISQGRAK